METTTHPEAHGLHDRVGDVERDPYLVVRNLRAIAARRRRLRLAKEAVRRITGRLRLW